MTVEETLAVIRAEAEKDPEFAAAWEKAVARQVDRTTAQLTGGFMRSDEQGRKLSGLTEVLEPGAVVPAPGDVSYGEAIAAFLTAVLERVQTRVEAMGITFTKVYRPEDL